MKKELSHAEIARKGGLATSKKQPHEWYVNKAYHMNAIIKQRKEAEKSPETTT